MPLLSADATSYVPIAAPAFDAVGSGGNVIEATAGAYTAEDTTWTHTANGPVLVFANTEYVLSASDENLPLPVRTATFGGTTMTHLGSIVYEYQFTTTLGYVLLDAFGLLTPITGSSQTVEYAFTFAAGVTEYVWAANSISYTNVTAFGAVNTSARSTLTPSITAPSVAGQMVVVAIGAPNDASTMTAFNQTSRWTATGASYLCTLVGDAPGAPWVNFQATQTPTGSWGCITVNLI